MSYHVHLVMAMYMNDEERVPILEGSDIIYGEDGVIVSMVGSLQGLVAGGKPVAEVFVPYFNVGSVCYTVDESDREDE